MKQLLQIPCSCNTCTSYIVCVCVFLGVCVVQDEAASLTSWLGNVRCAPLPDPSTHLTVSLRKPRSPESARVQLSVLRAMCFASADAERRVCLTLSGWHMVESTLSVLQQGLPSWACSVHFCECAWPLEAAQYEHLAECMPSSYTVWKLGGAEPAVVQSVCDGAERCMAGLGLPRLTVRAGKVPRSGQGRKWKHVKFA